MAASLSFAIYLWRGWWRASRSLDATRRSFESRHEALSAERDQWRASTHSALAGLGAAIDRQFATWKLTPTEREVALLPLKGYGHKQIAGTTQRSERTVRQHAVASTRSRDWVAAPNWRRSFSKTCCCRGNRVPNTTAAKPVDGVGGFGNGGVCARV